MAKDDELDIDDLDDEEGDGKKNKKMMTAIIAVFIVIIWIAIFCLLVKLDVGGFGSNVLYKPLHNIPVINKILPSVADDDMDSNSGQTYSTLEEAVKRINELEDEIAIYQKNADDNAEKISSLTADIKRLQVYENNQVLYEKLKKKFDEEVVYTDNAPDIEEYRSWYEEMDPDNAAEIYRQVVEQITASQEIQELADYYSKVKADAAASVFAEMTGDMEKVAKILKCMKADIAGAILAAMDPTYAAKITLLMYPTTEDNRTPEYPR